MFTLNQAIANERAKVAARAKAAVSRAQAASASPAGRFLACVASAQRVAVTQGKFDLADACEAGRSACSRGLDSNLVSAARALDAMEALGADVSLARAALADLMIGEAA